MGGHRNTVAKLTSCLILIVVLLLPVEAADGKVTGQSADKTKAEVTQADQGTNATAIAATSTASDAPPTSPTVGKDAKSEAPGAQPVSSPPPPPSCKRTIKADVVALAQ